MMENKKITRRRIIDSTSVPTSRRNGNKHFDIATSADHEETTGLSTEVFDRGPVEMKLADNDNECYSNATDTTRVPKAADSLKLQVKSISVTTDDVGSCNFVRAKKTTSFSNDQRGEWESNKSDLIPEKHSIFIGDKRVINTDKTFSRRVQEITAANAEMHSNAIHVNNCKIQVKDDVSNEPKNAMEQTKSSLTSLQKNDETTKFAMEKEVDTSDKNVAEYEACINASSYKKKEHLSNIENCLITIDQKIAEELSKVFDDTFYGRHKNNIGTLINFDNEPISVPMKQNKKCEVSFSDRVNTQSVKDNEPEETLPNVKKLKVKYLENNTTDLPNDKIMNNRDIKIPKAGQVLESNEFDSTRNNDNNNSKQNNEKKDFRYNEKLKTNHPISECELKIFSDKVIAHKSEKVDCTAKFENDHHQLKDNCLIISHDERAKQEMSSCETNSDKMKSLFCEDDVISSIDDDRSRSVVHSVMSDETLICHRNMGLFENHSDIVRDKSKSSALKLKTFHKESLEMNNNHKSHFITNIQKESHSNPSSLEHHDNPESVNNVQDIEPEMKTSNITSITEMINNVQTGYQKDPHLIELEMTKCILEHEESKETMLDLYEAFLRSFQDSPFLDHLAEIPEEADGDAEKKNVYSSLMEGPSGRGRLLSVEEKWQIIFNEKTRAPIYAVSHYIQYLNQFVNGKNASTRDSNDVIKREGIHPISYLLRKLKLDLKMSYESFVEEFVKPVNNGMGLLIKLLKSIQNMGSQQSGSTNKTQLKNYKKTLTDEHDCLLCIKYSLRLRHALKTFLEITYGIETVSMGVISTFTKSRGTAIEILTVCLSADEGFSRILDCFTYIQLKIGEPVRFKSLMNMMNTDSQQNTVFKVCTMKFLNSLLAAATNTNIRVYLQHELETAGLDITFMVEKASGTGLEYDDLRRELSDWQRKYVNVDTLLTQRGLAGIHRTFDPSQQLMVEELQSQVKTLSADKVYLEYQLSAVSKELRYRYEELQRKNPVQKDGSTQCSRPLYDSKSVACQCDLGPEDEESDDPLKVAADYFGWKDVYFEESKDIHHRMNPLNIHNEDLDDEFEVNDEITTSDDEGVVKVEQWLRSHCGSNENSGHRSNECTSECSTLFFKRDSLTRKQVRKAEFPGNWKIIPKSIEKFPARFAPNQCHQTNCDRCDLRNRSENSDRKPTALINKSSLEFRLDKLVKDKRRSEIKSQSSDSAIGGSGERLWNDRRNSRLPVVKTEAEILQDLIQPDDSASACPNQEPIPDYSVLGSKFNTQRSYSTELSKVLREFEGSLLQYETPLKSESTENFVTLGDI